MVTFEQWGEPQDFVLYAIKHDGNYVARLAIDSRPQFSNAIVFDNKKVFPFKVIKDVYTAIQQEFGELDIRVASS